METLKHLPEVNERIRGGLASLGYDRVLQIREEVGLLEQLASVVLGVTREQLTRKDVQDFVQSVALKQAAVESMTPAEVEQARASAAAVVSAAMLDGGAAEPRELVSTVIALTKNS